MNIIYTFEKFPKASELPSIFLAGPTIRTDQVTDLKSWRLDAIAELEKQGFMGYVFVPEYRDGKLPPNFDLTKQIDWETDGLTRATVILFWIPRTKELPALTTNIEFGEWVKSGKIVVGAPDYAEKVDYIKQKCSRNNVLWGNTLNETIDNCLIKIDELPPLHTKVWFTSDTHFGSQRTLELSRRPFASVREMDWAMVAKWNATVGPNDTVYHLGDFGDFSMLEHLIFGKLYLVPGNYDTLDDVERIERNYKNVTAVPDYSYILIKNTTFHMIHEPECGTTDPDNFYLYGHIHGLQKIKRNGLNVGVDCHNFAPVSEETILFYHNAITQHYDNNAFMERCGEEL